MFYLDDMRFEVADIVELCKKGDFKLIEFKTFKNQSENFIRNQIDFFKSISQIV